MKHSSGTGKITLEGVGMDSRNLVATMLFCFTTFFVSQSIATTYIPCDGCSFSQMSNVAVSHGVGRVLVGNVPGNTMQAFRVYLAPQPKVMSRVSNNKNTLFADLSSTSAQEAAAFSAYVEFHNAAPVGYNKHYELRIVNPGEPVGVPNSLAVKRLGDLIHSDTQSYGPMSVPSPGGGTVDYPTPGTNVYNVINSGPQQNAFLQWLAHLTVFGISNQTGKLVQAAGILHITDSSYAPQLSFTVTFTDGSHIGVYADTKQAPIQLVVNEDSGVDSHGNNVPATEEAVTGSGTQMYDFTKSGNETDHANMYQQITRFGVNLSPNLWQYACVSSGAGVGRRADCKWVQ